MVDLKDKIKLHELWLDSGGEKIERLVLVNEDLKHSYLSHSDLKGCDLKASDLRGAKLDYSCLPLWCGGIGWVFDDSLPRMLAAFICSMKCEGEETKEIQKILLNYAKKSHRAGVILGEKP